MAKNHKITGRAFFCKLLGDPVENYDGNANEWSIEISPNELSLNTLQRLGLGDKIKNKAHPKAIDDEGTPRGDYIVFRRNEKKKTPGKDGQLYNTPVPVFDAAGEPWPEGKSIGNGSTVQVKFGTLTIAPKGKFKGGVMAIIYEVKVLELKEYKRPVKADKPEAQGDEDWNKDGTVAQS